MRKMDPLSLEFAVGHNQLKDDRVHDPAILKTANRRQIRSCNIHGSYKHGAAGVALFLCISIRINGP